MLVILKHEINRVKNGYSARSPGLKLTAHGPTVDIAKRNLEHTVKSFLAPFERNGVLKDEVQAIGLESQKQQENGVDLLLI